MTTDHRPNPIFEDAVFGPSSEKGDGVLDTRYVDQEDVVPTQSRHIPLRYRLSALGFIIFITTGIEFAESTLGPLKHTLVTELEVDSESHEGVPWPDWRMPDAQFGVITTSTNLVNTILPILGGIGMDYYGAG
jgi:hypothetical protein